MRETLFKGVTRQIFTHFIFSVDRLLRFLVRFLIAGQNKSDENTLSSKVVTGFSFYHILILHRLSI